MFLELMLNTQPNTKLSVLDHCTETENENVPALDSGLPQYVNAGQEDSLKSVQPQRYFWKSDSSAPRLL